MSISSPLCFTEGANSYYTETTVTKTLQYVTHQHISMWAHGLITTAEIVARGNVFSENDGSK